MNKRRCRVRSSPASRRCRRRTIGTTAIGCLIERHARRDRSRAAVRGAAPFRVRRERPGVAAHSGGVGDPMMLPPTTRVYLACGFTDMRKGFDGLAGQLAARHERSADLSLCRLPCPRRRWSQAPCSTIVCSACRARRFGSSANAARRANKNTMRRTYRPIRGSRCLPPRSRHDGYVNRRISNSRKSWASTISRVDPGLAYTDMP